MKLKTSLGAAIALACSLASAALAATAPTATTEQFTSRIVVKYRDAQVAERATALSASTSTPEKASAQRARFPLSRLRVLASGAIVYHLGQDVSYADARAAAARIAQDPSVEYAEPDLRVQAHQAAPSNDSYSNMQWPLMARTSAAGGSDFVGAWTRTRGASVLVGVIDTGSLVHSDLAGQTVAGADFVSPDQGPNGSVTYATAGDGDGRDYDPTDPGDFCTTSSPASNSSWHGMKVASQIVALADNGVGIAGAAPNAKAMQIRAMGRCGGFQSDIADAIAWSVGANVSGLAVNTTPVQVINLSLGVPVTTVPAAACPQFMQTAINQALARNVPVVASAGNDAKNDVGAPANCTGVIVVGAHTKSADLAGYSNYSSAVTLTAPGGGSCALQTTTCLGDPTVSLGNNGLTTAGTELPGSYFAGTSAAAPHVTAAIALIRAVAPSLTPAEIKALLIATAKPHAADSYCAANPSNCGGGMLDAAAAVQAAVTPVLAVAHSYPNNFVAGVKPVSLSATVTGNLGSGYTWTQVSGTPVTMTGANGDTMSFTTPTVGGSLVFRVDATTSLGTHLSMTNTVVVNSAPALASKAFSVTSGAALSGKLVATDVDGDAVSFTLVDGPVGLTLQGDTLTWTAGVTGDFSVTVSMTDARGATSQGSAMVTVTAAPTSSGGSTGGSSSGGGGGGGGGSTDLVFLGLMAAGLLSFKARKR